MGGLATAFGDEATLAMGAAFDQACQSLPHSERTVAVREIIAKRIIEAAKNGELDPVRLCGKALRTFNIDGMWVPTTDVGRASIVPIRALLARVA